MGGPAISRTAAGPLPYASREAPAGGRFRETEHGLRAYPLTEALVCASYVAVTGSSEAFVRRFFGIFAVSCVLAGCASQSASQNGGQSDAGDEASITDALVPPALCATDPRAQSFTPGMEQPGKTGVFKARLLEMAPAPASKGDNGWTLQIVDAKGAPVDGATVTVKPFMPDHGHGSSIVPLVTPLGHDGKYTVTRLNLFMPGIWQMTVNVSAASNAADSAVFSFCVAG